MFHCITCGRPTDRYETCEECESDEVASLADRLLEEPRGGVPRPRQPSQAPRPLAEALAAEVVCPSCRTSVPPASRFCGVCGLHFEALAGTGAREA